MSRLWSRDLQLKNIQFSFKLRSVQSGFQIGGKQGFNLKKHLRGRHFQSSEAVVKAAEAVLKDLSKNGFQHVLADWQKRWDKYIASNGDYFEKDHQYSKDE